MNIYEEAANGNVTLLLALMIKRDVSLDEQKIVKELRIEFPQYAEDFLFLGWEQDTKVTPLEFLREIDIWTYDILYDKYNAARADIDAENARYDQNVEGMIPEFLGIGGELLGRSQCASEITEV